MKKLLAPLSIALLLALGFNANAQLETPQPSPGGSLTQKVRMAEIKIDYSRPSAKGRKVFGELLPFGELCR